MHSLSILVLRLLLELGIFIIEILHLFTAFAIFAIVLTIVLILLDAR